MRKLSATLIGIIAATTALAQFVPPPLIHDIEANSQQAQELIDMTIQQGANVSYRVRLKSRGKWLDLDGLTCRWDARETITNTNAYTATSSATVTNVTPNYFQIDLDNTQTGTAISNWTYSVIVLDGTDQYPQGIGRVDIELSAYTGSGATLTNCPFVTTEELAAHTNLTLALGAHGGELDPLWAAVSNTVTTGAALGATAIQTELDPIASSNLTVHIDDPTAAHAASAVSQTNTPMGTTVQDALDYANALLVDLESTKLDLAGGTMTGQIYWDADNFIGPDDINVVQGTATDYSEIRFTGAGTGGWRTFAASDWVAGIKISTTQGTEIGGDNGSITIATNGTITADQPISGQDAVAATDLATLQQILWTGTTNAASLFGDATVGGDVAVGGGGKLITSADKGDWITSTDTAGSGIMFFYLNNNKEFVMSGTDGIMANLAGGGAIHADAGTVLRPAVYITGEEDCGMWSPAADTLGFSAGGVSHMTLTGGNVGMVGALQIEDSTTPAANTDFAQFFATNAVSAEMWVMDGDGNATQLSSHDDNQKHIANSYNVYTGEGKSVDLWALAEAVQQLTGRSDIVTDYAMPARDWDEEQAVRVGKRDAAIGRWMSNTNSIEVKGAKPAKLEAKGKPQWLIDWMAAGSIDLIAEEVE